MRTDNDIKKLLDKFMQGESSPEEEAKLAEYFSANDDIPEEWKAYRDMFAYLENLNPVIHKPAERNSSKARMIILYGISIAAIFLIFFVLWHGKQATDVGDGIPQPVIAQNTDSVSTFQADSAQGVQQQTLPQKQIKRQRMRDMPQPPKTYMAQTVDVELRQNADSALDNQLLHIEAEKNRASHAIDMYLARQEQVIAQMTEDEENNTINE